MLPPSPDEWLPPGHAARFVAEFVDALSPAEWSELGIDVDGNQQGAPAYHPRAMLSVWVYGFMMGVRSSRKLELACREQIPYMWLTGCQQPDHVTLWRFYSMHREGMRKLLERTVRTAVKMDLVKLAVQAVDGTKVGADAAADRTYDADGLGRLLGRLEREIDELEAQNEAGEESSSAQLPDALRDRKALRDQLREALTELSDEDGGKGLNLTDRDARFIKTRQGIMPAYNAQAVVSPVEDGDGQSGMLITAVDVVDEPNDASQLCPMMDKAEETTGYKAEMTLADAGYHSGSALEECARREQLVAMPESQNRALSSPYHKDRFIYDETGDTYDCPQGHRLRFARLKRTRGVPMRLYRASGTVCRACPAFGVCTKDGRHGRALEVGPHETLLRRHRDWMSTDEAIEAYSQRKYIVEPVFGIIKEQQGGRRFLLRGKANVVAEWTLLATAFNLRTLWRMWRATIDRIGGWGPALQANRGLRAAVNTTAPAYLVVQVTITRAFELLLRPRPCIPQA